MEATWINEYDLHTDKVFKSPGCPECNEPFRMCKDGKYRCFSCNKVVDVHDEEMLNWLASRSETKVTMEDDPVITVINGTKMGCGGKKCVETHWVRNRGTLEWQIAYGRCKNCGSQFIV